MQQPEEAAKFMRSILPDHYTCEPTGNGVHCYSATGISDEKDNDAEFKKIMKSIREHFGADFSEVFHQTCSDHLKFTVFLK